MFLAQFAEDFAVLLSLSVELGLFLREVKSGEMLAWREYCIDVTLAASCGI